MFKRIVLTLCCVISTQLSAQDYSRTIPYLIEALDHYSSGEIKKSTSPVVDKIVRILECKNISKAFIQKRLNNVQKKDYLLPAPDSFDQLIDSYSNPFPFFTTPPIALHAFRLDVIDPTDDWFKDDLYMYFFITDGVIPTGKVTSIYKGLAAGESITFNESDRAVFPLVGIGAKVPSSHLIVDYGLIESDGDDIAEMKKLTAIIIDIAITVYTTYDPTVGQVLGQLRREIKALADLLLELNHDDRLFADTVALTNAEISEHLKNQTFYQFDRVYKNNASLNSWKYKVNFRLIRE